VTDAALDVAYRVRFDEAGPDGRVYPSILLAWAQDAAWVHSTALGFGRDWYAAHGLAWLVRGAELTLDDPPRYGDDVIVRTDVVGFRRVLARRLTTYRRPDGREVARSLTDWALLDARGRPTRIPDEFARLVSVPAFEPIAVPSLASDAAPGFRRAELSVRPRDIDPMGHANNSAYLNYLDEALAGAGERLGGDRTPRSYRLVYLRPATPGAALSAIVAPTRDGLTNIVLRDTHGTELVRAVVGDGVPEGSPAMSSPAEPADGPGDRSGGRGT
jgi:medium-chain acyl-[acyl-carrier-protein] hydrolase